ncbi:GntR family transcriptional regulator, partial [Nocardiopsis trehalosi]|uniref:GntR family transcriptional regulator n=1 Tax=Nocardiopsis trehalosi TaxID=109329 RepID=UPI001FDF170F
MWWVRGWVCSRWWWRWGWWRWPVGGCGCPRSGEGVGGRPSGVPGGRSPCPGWWDTAAPWGLPRGAAGCREVGVVVGSGSDFLQLDVREAPAGGVAEWLAGRLREAIADGRVPVGGRLPASRVLAAELRVSRGVVTEAYRRLGEDGHVVGRGRGG